MCVFVCEREIEREIQIENICVQELSKKEACKTLRGTKIVTTSKAAYKEIMQECKNMINKR